MEARFIVSSGNPNHQMIHYNFVLSTYCTPCKGFQVKAEQTLGIYFRELFMGMSRSFKVLKMRLFVSVADYEILCPMLSISFIVE